MKQSITVFFTLISLMAGLSAPIAYGASDAPFDAIPLDGLATEKEVTLKQLSTGKPRYLKFWATWCQPCLAQMPHFEKAQKRVGNEVDIVAINIDINDSTEDIKAVKKRFELTMPIVVDKSGELAQHFNLKGTPLHVLLSAQGDLIYSGHEADEALDSQLEQLAKGAPAAKKNANQGDNQDRKISISDQGLQAVFFSATWCDWYLEESRPAISQNCTNANMMLNQLAEDFTDIQFQGVYNRLWTEPKDLEEYRNKYKIKVPIAIDQSNQTLLEHQIKDFPTLVLFREGKELTRIHSFDEQKAVKKALKAALE